jgi:cystathionine beta-lyase
MRTIDAAMARAWLFDGGEVAFLDVREAGAFGEGHAFLAVPLPYSRLELDVARLVPRLRTRIVLIDAGDGVAARAGSRLESLGYADVHQVEGGVDAWTAAGFRLFQGVNVPSKAFGEAVEHALATPHLGVDALAAMQAAGQPVVLLDGRPPEEHRKMAVPGSVCCPNGELALRAAAMAPDPATPIVVHCAGRTRSIVGAQTLIDLGLPNPVFALENGTQGWMLADKALEHGSTRRYPPLAADDDLRRPRARASALAARQGIAVASAADLMRWRRDPERTTVLLDVRTAEEVADDPIPGARHAPGGQLLQATDQFVGTRNARLVLADRDGIRAPVTAVWLRRLGYTAWVAPIEALAESGAAAWTTGAAARFVPEPPAGLAPAELAALLADDRVRLIDLRPSQTFRQGHVAGATWSIRPLVPALVAGEERPIVVAAVDPLIAALAVLDLPAEQAASARLLEGGLDAWRAAGLPVVATPDDPPDSACIDFLFFVHDRHEGNKDAARRYLAWETGLLDTLEADERALFRLGR